jgi:hypothetical protein
VPAGLPRHLGEAVVQEPSFDVADLDLGGQ